jgi:alpha-galactosidase/6-phospho-beta-glucosidase family protein
LAATGDRDLLYQAFRIDPLTNSLADGRAMIEDLLKAQREVLPDYWRKN